MRKSLSSRLSSDKICANEARRLLFHLVVAVGILPVSAVKAAPDTVSQIAQAPANPAILPADPSAIGGGNPLQGLGRNDEPAPSRRSQFETQPAVGGSAGGGAVETPQALQSPYYPAGSFNPLENPPVSTGKSHKSKNKEHQQLGENLIKKAVLDLQSGHYEECLSTINAALEKNDRNAEAHYIKAVLFVTTIRYPEARNEYNAVLDNSSSEELTRLAKTGLSKLDRK